MLCHDGRRPASESGRRFQSGPLSSGSTAAASASSPPSSDPITSTIQQQPNRGLDSPRGGRGGMGIRAPRVATEAHRGMRLVLGMGVLFLMSALRSAVDPRVLEATRTARQDRSNGNSHNNNNNDEDPPALLPWLPWEIKAITNGSCRPPADVPERCCVGTSSQGGELHVSEECLSKGTVRATNALSELRLPVGSAPAPPTSSRHPFRLSAYATLPCRDRTTG
jgi:hypothetical protein